jgi:TRAP transporter TAXI family solute receptor
MPEPLFGELLDGLGWTKADLGGIVEMPRDQQITALCDGKIAAIALSAPHPNGFVRQALGACPLFELDLQGAALVSVLAGHPAYAPATIDLGIYTGASRPMQSFGPRAVLVTTMAADEQAITRILSAIFRHTEELKKAHPAFGGLTTTQIGSDAGLGAPRHPIVAKYLSENAMSGPPGGQ